MQKKCGAYLPGESNESASRSANDVESQPCTAPVLPLAEVPLWETVKRMF